MSRIDDELIGEQRQRRSYTTIINTLMGDKYLRMMILDQADSVAVYARALVDKTVEDNGLDVPTDRYPAWRENACKEAARIMGSGWRWD